MAAGLSIKAGFASPFAAFSACFVLAFMDLGDYFHIVTSSPFSLKGATNDDP